MIPPEERDWDKYLSKDNHSREELSPEEEAMLQAYEEYMELVEESENPKWVADFFSHTSLDFKCNRCGKRYTPRDDRQEYCSDYCFYHNQI